MDNYVQPGDIVELTAPAGGVTVGVPVKIGRLFAVPTVSALVNEKFAARVRGVVDIPKVAAEPWTEGLLIYYNSGSALATSTSTTAMRIGISVAVRANPTSTGRVLLNHGAFDNQ